MTLLFLLYFLCSGFEDINTKSRALEGGVMYVLKPQIGGTTFENNTPKNVFFLSNYSPCFVFLLGAVIRLFVRCAIVIGISEAWEFHGVYFVFQFD